MTLNRLRNYLASDPWRYSVTSAFKRQIPGCRTSRLCRPTARNPSYCLAIVIRQGLDRLSTVMV